MVDVVGDSAHDVIEKSIEFVLEHGEEAAVWGGTIPERFDDDDSPNDRDRDMIEYTDGFSYKLTKPQRRWCEWSRHWPGITLREVEDDLRALNPGLTPMYSKPYQEWVEDTDDGDDILPHTYGQRMQQYGVNTLTDDRCVNGGIPGSTEDNTPFIDQWESVKSFLKKRPQSRKACMTYWDPHVDAQQIHSETNAYVPCNVFFQLYVRGGELHWHTMSRSKDILRGSSENIFEFTLLQELMVRELNDETDMNLSVGDYVEHVSNIHIYKEQIDDGYLEHNIVDPYTSYYTSPISVLDGDIQDVFELADDYLLDHEYEEAFDTACEIAGSVWGGDQYWSEWKQGLVLEYWRMQDPDSAREAYLSFFEDNMGFAWEPALAKRAYREWEDDDILAGIPDNIHQSIRDFE